VAFAALLYTQKLMPFQQAACLGKAQRGRWGRWRLV
jgi:hypothetical protein